MMEEKDTFKEMQIQHFIPSPQHPARYSEPVAAGGGGGLTGFTSSGSMDLTAGARIAAPVVARLAWVSLVGTCYSPPPGITFTSSPSSTDRIKCSKCSSTEY